MIAEHQAAEGRRPCSYLVVRHLPIHFTPKVGDLNFYFRQSGRLVAIIRWRLHDEPTGFIDKNLDVFRLGIDNPILANAVLRV